jgi:Tol biopolymer transport system component
MIGSAIGPYHVLEKLGEGGMGEVFRAYDTKLGRDVAIKRLPPEFAGDPERLSRFQREARVLAALNHPNIAAIYELEESGGGSYLVMELVDGGTLAGRLARSGPLPFDAALRIAVQVAGALDAAHQKGIVHRDLKPANIGLTAQDTVKVLDFGLAKVAGPSGTDWPDLATRTSSITESGVIIGTLPYMSPEQLQGKPVDQRSDIWAFGAILHEMLTGRRLFGGASSADTIAAVLTSDIDLDRVPAALRPLLARCLERDASRRLRHIGDIGLQLESEARPVPRLAGSTKRAWAWPAIAAAAVVAALTAGWRTFYAPPPAPGSVTRLEVVEPAGVTFTDQFNVSPDGRRIAFIARTNDRRELWIRSLENFEARALVNEPVDGSTPIWSPDGEHIIYWHRGSLMRVDTGGGPSQSVAKGPQPESGFWLADGRVVLAQRDEGLLQVSLRTGTAAPLTTLSTGELMHRTPAPLPGGTHFVYARLTGSGQGNIHVGALDTAADRQDLTPLVTHATAVAFAVSRDAAPGYLVFLRNTGQLFAQRFDPSRRSLSGDPILLAEHVADRPATALGGGALSLAAFSVSSTGVLAYRTELKAADQLTVFDRRGTIVDRIAEPDVHGQIALSPSENHLAAVHRGADHADIYIHEVTGARRRTRFTFGPPTNGTPVWSPDGRRIAFSSERDGGRLDVYVKAAFTAGGQEERLYQSPDRPGARPTDWSPDGRHILLWSTIGSGRPQNDVVLLSVADGTARTLVAGAGFASFSPDGRWVAYWTNRSGRGEIYVRPFDPSAALADLPEWTVSKGARSIRPLWKGDEIFYRDIEQNIMSVRVKAGGGATPTFVAGVPEPLFPLAQPIQPWAVSTDRQRFILAAPATEAQAAAFRIVQNWELLAGR